VACATGQGCVVCLIAWDFTLSWYVVQPVDTTK
jgi:hypothetical protein